MTQTWEEWKKENNISLGFSEEMLKRLPLCRGKPVILTATFNVRSRETNRLIFKSVMPYTEILPHKRGKNVQKKSALIFLFRLMPYGSIKEKPTIKEYVIYASLHMLKVEKSCEKQKRKRR